MLPHRAARQFRKLGASGLEVSGIGRAIIAWSRELDVLGPVSAAPAPRNSCRKLCIWFAPLSPRASRSPRHRLRPKDGIFGDLYRALYGGEYLPLRRCSLSRFAGCPPRIRLDVCKGSSARRRGLDQARRTIEWRERGWVPRAMDRDIKARNAGFCSCLSGLKCVLLLVLEVGELLCMDPRQSTYWRMGR